MGAGVGVGARSGIRVTLAVFLEAKSCLGERHGTPQAGKERPKKDRGGAPHRRRIIRQTASSDLGSVRGGGEGHHQPRHPSILAKLRQLFDGVNLLSGLRSYQELAR